MSKPGGRQLFDYLPHIAILAALEIVLVVGLIAFILIKKRDPTVAAAWIMVVLLLPLVGAFLFWVFGYNYMHRRVTRKRRHKDAYDRTNPPARKEADRGEAGEPVPLHPLMRVATAVGAFPPSPGNLVRVDHDTNAIFGAMLADVKGATNHVHLMFYIIRDDGMGRRLVEALIDRLRSGVEVRLLYDGVGSFSFVNPLFDRLKQAGGKVEGFLPVNPLRSWVQVNLRNHRKIMVIDGRIGYTGGMNIGDEYLGLDPAFGPWRDTMARVEGPAVAGLQRTFAEDWHFATGEVRELAPYFPDIGVVGPHVVQVVDSGPDQDINPSREVYFAAIASATSRLWIASPYFVPDGGLLDALRHACLRGVDVRLLCLLKPDHAISYYAGRYFWSDFLRLGGRVWQYTPGMMHSKYLVADDVAVVGSANFDNRSLHLNFEAGVILYDATVVEELAEQFRRDLEASLPLDPWAFGQRRLTARLVENACRLFAPVL